MKNPTSRGSRVSIRETGAKNCKGTSIIIQTSVLLYSV